MQSARDQSTSRPVAKPIGLVVPGSIFLASPLLVVWENYSRKA